MAIAERALSAADANTGTSAATTLQVSPTGMVLDDLMIAVFATVDLSEGESHAAPSGWLQIGSTQTTSKLTLSMWGKWAGSSEAGPYTFNNGSGFNRRMTLSVRAFSGVNTSTPQDATATQSSSASATSLTHAASTSNGTGRLWLLATAKGHASVGTTGTMNTPAGFTETIDQCTTASLLSNCHIALDHKAVGSGSTGTQLVNGSDSTATHWAGIGLLLVPSGAANTVTASAAITQTSTVGGDTTVVGSVNDSVLFNRLSLAASGQVLAGGTIPIVTASAAITHTLTLQAATQPPAGAAPVQTGLFDGIRWPKVHVLAGFGPPQAGNVCIVGGGIAGTMLAGLGLSPDQTPSEITADLNHLQAVGVKAIWIVLALEWVSTGSGTWDSAAIAKYDEIITQTVARGLPIILQAHGMPTWITTASGHTANTWHGPDTAGERTDWVGALHNFIARYGAEKFTAVEIWNEPNLDTFWVQGSNAADYARLLQACWVDLKATWPALKLVGHNMSRNHVGWLQSVYTQTDTIFTHATAAANSHYFDVLGVHPYCGNSTSGFNPTDVSHVDESTPFGALDPDFLGYRRLRDEITTHEGAAKPVAFGEFGYTTTSASWFFVVEATRAQYLTTAIALAAADGYVEYFIPFFHDSFGVVGGGFNLHGTSTETAFTAAVPQGGPGGGGIVGTSTVGGIHMVEIGANVRSISRSGPGRDSPIDTATPTTVQIVVNNGSGDYDPTNLAGPYVAAGVSLVDVGAPIQVLAERPIGQFYSRFVGTIVDVELDAGLDPTVTFTCADGLEDYGRAQLATQAAPVFVGDYTGERIGRLLDQIGRPASMRLLDRGSNALGGTVLGASVAELIRKTELTEFGFFFIDADGRDVFYDRHRAENADRSVIVQANLTDSSGPGEFGMVELILSLSRERVVNDVHITRDPPADDPEQEMAEVVATDEVSRKKYGLLSLGQEIGTLLVSDAEALSLAQGVASQFSTAGVRIREVRINALAQRVIDEGLWPTLLGLRLLDRISVRRDYGPNTIGPTELLIQRFDEEINSDPITWEIRLTTSEPPTPVAPVVPPEPGAKTCRVGEGKVGTDLVGF